MAALDDRSGRELTITLDAKAWPVALACRKTKDLGYTYELWTTRFLAGQAREHGPVEAHACLADLAQGTLCKILAQDKVKPHNNVIFFATMRSRLCREDARGAVSLS
jgi:hypothetical protein